MISSFAIGRYAVKIYQDGDGESPRDWDNLGRMVCFHRRYELGDRHNLSSADFGNWAEVEEYLIHEMGAFLIFPLYLYDHSGLHMKIGSFSGRLPAGHAEFDSGQVGFIYCTKQAILDNWGYKRVTGPLTERARQLLVAEVEEYDQYLAGDVYGYVVEDEDGEHVDSCGGFYGYDYCNEEARKAAEHAEREYIKAVGVQMELIPA